MSFLFIFIVILLNLGLGFAAAVHLERIYRLEHIQAGGDGNSTEDQANELASLLDEFSNAAEDDTKDVDVTEGTSITTESSGDETSESKAPEDTKPETNVTETDAVEKEAASDEEGAATATEVVEDDTVDTSDDVLTEATPRPSDESTQQASLDHGELGEDIRGKDDTSLSDQPNGTDVPTPETAKGDKETIDGKLAESEPVEVEDNTPTDGAAESDATTETRAQHQEQPDVEEASPSVATEANVVVHLEQTAESSAADSEEIDDVLKDLEGLTQDFLGDKGKDLATQRDAVKTSDI